jgi:restriction endonuclease S subunit
VDLLERAGVQSAVRRDRAVVRDRDVLLTARGTSLRAAVVPAETEGAIASANLLVVRLKPELLPEVLVAFLETAAGRKQLVAHATASAVGAFVITPKALSRLEITVPPMSIQIELAAFVRAGTESIRAAERVLDLRKELVRGVIEDVFHRGELSIDAGALQ